MSRFIIIIFSSLFFHFSCDNEMFLRRGRRDKFIRNWWQFRDRHKWGQVLSYYRSRSSSFVTKINEHEGKVVRYMWGMFPAYGDNTESARRSLQRGANALRVFRPNWQIVSQLRELIRGIVRELWEGRTLRKETRYSRNHTFDVSFAPFLLP